MTTFTKAFAIVLLSLPLLSHAAGKTATATMQVTFEVKEACTVQTSAGALNAVTSNSKATPAVACQLKTPYAVTRNTSPAAANSGNAQATAIRQETGAGEWTITF